MGEVGEAIKDGVQNMSVENEITSTVANSAETIGSTALDKASGSLGQLAESFMSSAGPLLGMLFAGKEILDPEKLMDER